MVVPVNILKCKEYIHHKALRGYRESDKVTRNGSKQTGAENEAMNGK